MSERPLAEMLADLRQSQQALLNLLSQAEADVLYRRSGEDDWTAAEALVHMAEARRFFTGELQKVLATPGTQVGRTAEHPGRLKNIADHGHDPAAEIRQKLVTSHEHMVKTLTGLTEDDLKLQAEYVNLGPLTLAEFIERLLVGHDRAHVQQVRELLANE